MHRGVIAEYHTWGYRSYWSSHNFNRISLPLRWDAVYTYAHKFGLPLPMQHILALKLPKWVKLRKNLPNSVSCRSLHLCYSYVSFSLLFFYLLMIVLQYLFNKEKARNPWFKYYRVHVLVQIHQIMMFGKKKEKFMKRPHHAQLLFCFLESNHTVDSSPKFGKVYETCNFQTMECGGVGI